MKWKLTLYIAGNGARSVRTESNLRRICADYLGDGHELEVVDVMAHPDRAERENILITPTVVRSSPSPTQRLVGDLSDTKAVLYGLDLYRETKDGGTEQ